MDFRLNQEQLQLRETARRFANTEMKPVAEAIENSGEPMSREWNLRYAEMGFLGINIPEKYGGLGMGHLEALLVLEEFARVSCAVAFPVFEANVGPVLAIERYADEELKARVIPRVCRGEIVVAAAMSEPEAGSALTDLKTRGEIRGNKIVIDGSKRWISGGGHSDGYVVYCRLGDDPGARGIGAVYVEKTSPGVSFGEQERFMGLRGLPSSDIYFDGVEVPLDHLIVPAGGFTQMMQAFDLERCGNATMSLAQAAAALQDVLVYVQEREQFGKPVIQFQAVQLKLAEMAMRVEAARLLIHRAVVNAEQGFPDLFESSVAKCYSNEIVREVTGHALQLMGAYGYCKEYPLERRLRDGWAWGIAGGTIDIQKINIAAAMAGQRFDQRWRERQK